MVNKHKDKKTGKFVPKPSKKQKKQNKMAKPKKSPDKKPKKERPKPSKKEKRSEKRTKSKTSIFSTKPGKNIPRDGILQLKKKVVTRQEVWED